MQTFVVEKLNSYFYARDQEVHENFDFEIFENESSTSRVSKSKFRAHLARTKSNWERYIIHLCILALSRNLQVSVFKQLVFESNLPE